MKQLLVIAYLFLVSGVTQAYNGSVAAVHFQKDIPTESVSHYYSYDADGRLISSEVELVETGETVRNQLATYAYNLDGSLKNTHLPHANEQQDYRYTAEGWLKGVNKIEEVVDGSNKSFAYQLAYYPEDYTEYNNGLSTALASADGDFTGNIGAMQWKSRMPDIITESDAPVYRFTYDSKYQLTGAVWGALENNTFVPSTTQAYHVSGLNYDPNGNIQFLERKDIDGATKHHLQYNYEGIDNRLTSVTNYGTYDYDVIGRLETATKVGESPINYGYNSDGLLATITAPSTQISFGYDEAYRIKKENTQTGQTTWYVRDINGNLLAIYSDATTQKEVPLYGSNRVGMYQRQGKVYRYELKDHLGNVRVVINKTGTNTPLVETTKDYYPFGSLLRQAGIGYRYGYQGDFAEDETDETGFNSFQLRMYDPVIGRWTTPDPYGQHASPYLGMGNNPISRIDPNGGIDGYKDNDGNYEWHENHHEQTFTDDSGTKWTKVTDNRHDWDKALMILEANRMGLEELGFDREQIRRDVNMYHASSPEFTKHSVLSNQQNYTGTWEAQLNSETGDFDARMSPMLGSTPYALKFYVHKGGVLNANALGLVRNDMVVKGYSVTHVFEAIGELFDDLIMGTVNLGPVQFDNWTTDMHYDNARLYLGR